MTDSYKLKVLEVNPLTKESVEVKLGTQESDKALFQYIPGQYLTFIKNIDGEELRRSYSICSGPEDDHLSVAIKKISDGRFSSYANDSLRAGEELDTMVPEGLFVVHNPKARFFSFIAAGSGITPIISMISRLLHDNHDAHITLVYGNKTTSSIMFLERLEDLKNLYMERLNLIYVLSREEGENHINNGRIDAEKVAYLFEQNLLSPDMEGVYMCGPSAMIMDLKNYFVDKVGMDSTKVHFELFNTDDLNTNNSAYEKNLQNKELSDKVCNVQIEVDGRNYQVDIAYGGKSILDAALDAGADLPYACKGGVCCTCRAKVLEGEVDMEKNYALEEDELEAGFILSCQSHPKTEKVRISFDYK